MDTRILRLCLAGLAAGALLAAPTSLLAWGNSGHRMIGQAAMRALPADLPAFLRSPAGVIDVGELSREPDRSKGAGRLHDNDRDAAHFVDLDDDGRILHGPPMLPLQPTRNDYETQLRALGLDSVKTGYLPYAIIDRYQQLTLDFAYWRVLSAAEANPRWAKHRAWFKADRIRREALFKRDLGELSHFVADGSQPLHVTLHFNGWGDGPNPNGFTNARIHSVFESDFVNANLSRALVEAAMTPLPSSGVGAIDKEVGRYLTATGRLVIPLYQLEKDGGFRGADPRGIAFAAGRLAVGASELRNLVVDAWRASAASRVGWRPIAVQDVLDGKVDPYTALYGVD